ncbi:MAG: WS/DGAT/MGAT family O-acyltransferase [Acidimicrobiales bacterium]
MAYERLSAQDSAFLHVEKPQQPMHVGSLGILDGGPLHDEHGRFKIDEARDVIASRLHLVPRFRKKVLFVPLQQGRPVWVDDEQFDLAYHVRLTALPKPGSEEQLLALFARIQGHLLDRRRPLWELWFVEGLEGGRVATIQKTHHCMVDGVSGVDVATVLFDLSPEVTQLEPPPWKASPSPSPTQLMLESVVERAVEPAEIVRTARAAWRGPRRVLDRTRDLARVVVSTVPQAPKMPWNVPISPHRRWVPVRVPLAEAKAIKDAASADPRFGGRITLNDVVLASVTAGLRAFLESRDEPLDPGLELKAMCPVTMRPKEERDAAAAQGSAALGNRVSMMTAALPVGLEDPADRLRAVSEVMRTLKESGDAVSADMLVQMTNYVPPTVLAMASRLLVGSRAVNLTVTNVPGPQFPLYCLGAEVLEAFPYVPILDGQALCVAILSYNGQLEFGITTDRDVMPDIPVFADGIRDGFRELAKAVPS